jgi:hypothetical protein
MAKTVIILGAGASRHTGAPLMNEFLERAWDLLAGSYDHPLGAPQKNDFALVRKGVNALQLAHSKGDVNIWNLEAVFDAFEMAHLCGRLGDLDEETVQRLPDAMRQVIVTTLQESIQLPVEPRRQLRGDWKESAAYGAFAEALARVRAETGEYPAIITFNYDVCLDLALAQADRAFSYCLHEPTGNGALRLLKLHGSLSWAYCESCRYVAEQSRQDLVTGAANAERLAREDHSDSYQLKAFDGPLDWVRCSCPEPKPQIMLVPPTMNKGRYQEVLKPVWSAAADVLSTAEDILICGYSLPPSDLFFRYLYSVGTIGEAGLRRVRVWDPDESGEVKARFEALLGKQVLGQLGRFVVHHGRFESVHWASVLTPG